jgi:hypothetical protein
VDLGVDLREWRFPIFGQLITHDRSADYWMHKHDAMVASMLGMNQCFAFVFENVWPLILVLLIRRRASMRRAKAGAQRSAGAAAGAQSSSAAAEAGESQSASGRKLSVSDR